MTTEDKITTEDQLKWLYCYDENRKFGLEIEQFTWEEGSFDQVNLKEGVSSRTAINTIVLAALNIVFSVLQDIYLYNNDPFKCIDWTGGILRKYDGKFSTLIKTLIIEALTDKKRFHMESVNLKIVMDGIERINMSKLHKEPFIDCSAIEYFLGKDGLLDYNDFLTAFFAVRGQMKSDIDIAKELIEKHWSEILVRLKQKDLDISDQRTKLTTLDQAFESTSKYYYIMNLLVENKFCQPGTYNWKDDKNSNLSTVISLLKMLQIQGYYKENKKLEAKEIRNIALNTFGMSMSESLIKQHKLNETEKAVKLIPPASTVN